MQNVYAMLALIFWIFICSVEGTDEDIKNYENIRKTMTKQYRSYNQNKPPLYDDKNFEEKMKNILPKEFNLEWIKNSTPLKDGKCDNSKYYDMEPENDVGKNEGKTFDISTPVKNFDISTPWNSRHNDGRNIMMQKYRNLPKFHRVSFLEPGINDKKDIRKLMQKYRTEPNFQKFHKVSPVKPDINDKKDIRKSMKKYRSEPNLHEIKTDDNNQDKNNKKNSAIGNKERKDSDLTDLSNSLIREDLAYLARVSLPVYKESRKMMKKYRSIPKFEPVMGTTNVDAYNEGHEQSNSGFHTASNSPREMTKPSQENLEHELENIAIVFKESDNVIKEIFKE